MIAAILLFSALTSPQAEPHIKAAAAQFAAGKQAARSGEFDRASQLFHDAIKIEPTFLDAYEQIIALDLKTNHRLDAGAVITQYLEIEPASTRYRLLLAQILLEQKHVERALAQYSLVLRRDPKNAEALLGFAKAAGEAGMPERASQALERGRKLYPADKRFNR